MHLLTLYYPEGHQDHQLPGHPERPERVEAIKTGLEEINLWDQIPRLEPLELAENIKSGKAFNRGKKMAWKCINCGYIHEGEGAPEKCPACVRPSGYFELFCKCW